jgi:hypothetical protein
VCLAGRRGLVDELALCHRFRAGPGLGLQLDGPRSDGDDGRLQLGCARLRICRRSGGRLRLCGRHRRCFGSRAGHRFRPERPLTKEVVDRDRREVGLRLAERIGAGRALVDHPPRIVVVGQPGGLLDRHPP